MIGNPATAPLIGGVGLLERAIGYSLGSLQLVTPEAMSLPTPCQAWDLTSLLRHMNDSFEALHEAVAVRHVGFPATLSRGGPALDPVTTLRDRACSVLGAWSAADAAGLVSVAGYPLTTGVVAATGAVEVTVHGWDVAQTCGRPRPIPAAVAEELLPLAALLVTSTDRPHRFADPITLPPIATPGETLLGFLGRDPR